MKRTDFIKSIFGIAAIGASAKLIAKETPVKLEGSGSIKSDQTITINGCTQYLNSNPNFVVGDDIISIKGSDLKIAVTIGNKHNRKFR